MRIPLFRRREALRPTWAGWLVLAVGALIALRLSAPAMYGFLAPGSHGRVDYLVVEGWISDDAVPGAVARIRDGGHRAVFTTGGPLDYGGFLAEYKDCATAARATLVAAGAPEAALTAVPAPRARKDRTFASAVALRDHFAASGIASGTVGLVTFDTHARRSRLLFRRALGPAFRVETLPYPCPRFGRADWWRSSEGVRAVIYEGMAWVYSALATPDPATESARKVVSP